MRIGIYCLGISPHYTGGINSYLLGLLKGFIENNTQHHFVLFINYGSQEYFKTKFPNKNISIRVVKSPTEQNRVRLEKSIRFNNEWLYKTYANFLYRHVEKEISTHCDVLYIPSTILSYFNSRIPTVLSMHDIQHVHFPQFFDPWELRKRTLTYKVSARHATYMQVSSNYILQDFMHYFSFLKKENMVLIAEGVNIEAFSEAVSNDILTKYNLQSGYLFMPAQLWPHKNHITLLKALDVLNQQGTHLTLVFTGTKYAAADQLFKYIAENKLTNVKHLGAIPFEDIIALYKHALLLIMPSLHESNSIPILEAAASGIPIVASNIAPNIELQENLQLNIFEQLNYNQLAGLIKELHLNTELLAQQALHNKQNITKYLWINSAKLYLDLFEKIT